MNYIFVGLGNPGQEYEETRHNAGRSVVARLQAKPPSGGEFADWQYDKKLTAEVAKGKIGKQGVTLVLPETFMNLSGKSVKPLVTSEKQATQLVVVHDDMDLPLGGMKIVFNRGSGGHKGVESIMRAIKTKAFIRVRLGVSATTPSGKLKKPGDEAKVLKFIVGPFKPAEKEIFKKVVKRAVEALVCIAEEGRDKATNIYNTAK